MTWYFHDKEGQRLLCVTPRVASTSQRKWYKERGYLPIEESEATALHKTGIETIATLREPMERTISAYRRHKPGFVRKSFEEYVKERYNWDSHVMPQTSVHKRHDITPTAWIMFEDLTSVLPVHANATPPEFKNLHRIYISEEFLSWFQEIYAEDYEILSTYGKK